MRFIANENIMATVISELRRLGHDIIWAKETMPGATDGSVLAIAQNENRIILTHDKDFGELAFRYCLPADSGVLLLRPSGSGPKADADQLVSIIHGRHDWPGHFSVLSQGRLRMRPLPTLRKPK